MSRARVSDDGEKSWRMKEAISRFSRRSGSSGESSETGFGAAEVEF